MPQMIGSFEDRQAKLREALNSLLIPDEDLDNSGASWLCIEATYPDTVICTVSSNNDDDSYEVPYSFDPSGAVALGMPSPVTLSVVATPGDTDDGDDGDDDGDDLDDADDADPNDAVMVRFLGPAASSIGDALSYVMSAPAGTEGKAFSKVREQVLRLLDGLAVKGVDMSGIGDGSQSADTTGDPSGDDTGDDEDPWAGLLDPDPSLAPDDSSDDGSSDGSDDALSGGEASLASNGGEDGTPDGATTSGDYPSGDDSGDTGDGMVSLDPDQIKAELAGLHANDDDSQDSAD